jgi:hypothetical protein
MVEKLSRSASGLRHLRWAREIYATLAAHAADTQSFGDKQRAALGKELGRLDGRIQALSAAVKGYRDFLERERVRYRGAIRAALHAGAEVEGALLVRRPELAAGLTGVRAGRPGTLDEARAAAERLRRLAKGTRSDVAAVAAAADRVEAAISAMQEEALPRQRSLKGALEAAIAGLREGLEDMDGRMAAMLSEAFAASLYPPLAAGGTMVADEADEDDDATARAG